MEIGASYRFCGVGRNRERQAVDKNDIVGVFRGYKDGDFIFKITQDPRTSITYYDSKKKLAIGGRMKIIG